MPDMEKEIKLSPCPFCGGEVKKDIAWGRNAVIHPDGKCLLANKIFFLDGWNHRPAEDKEELNTDKVRKLIIDLSSMKGLTVTPHDKALVNIFDLATAIVARFNDDAKEGVAE